MMNGQEEVKKSTSLHLQSISVPDTYIDLMGIHFPGGTIRTVSGSKGFVTGNLHHPMVLLGKQ